MGLRTFRPIEMMVNIYLIIVLVPQSFQTQTNLPAKLISMSLEGFSERAIVE